MAGLLDYLFPQAGATTQQAAIQPQQAQQPDQPSIWNMLLQRIAPSPPPGYDLYGGRLDVPDKVADSLPTGRGFLGLGSAYPDNGPLGNLQSFSLYNGGFSPSIFDPTATGRGG